jgi:uncharacterized membrane protein
MGEEDMRRQRPNVERMNLLGAEVRPVAFGKRTLKEATSEAIRDWITNVATTHYLIGTAFALLFVLLVSPSWLARPTLLPALLFGMATVVVPFFTMQPSFGLGVAASKTPSPNRARLKSLMTHTVFGVGLYVWAFVLRSVVFRA